MIEFREEPSRKGSSLVEAVCRLVLLSGIRYTGIPIENPTVIQILHQLWYHFGLLNMEPDPRSTNRTKSR